MSYTPPLLPLPVRQAPPHACILKRATPILKCSIFCLLPSLPDLTATPPVAFAHWSACKACTAIAQALTQSLRCCCSCRRSGCSACHCCRCCHGRGTLHWLSLETPSLPATPALWQFSASPLAAEGHGGCGGIGACSRHIKLPRCSTPRRMGGLPAPPALLTPALRVTLVPGYKSQSQSINQSITFKVHEPAEVSWD